METSKTKELLIELGYSMEKIEEALKVTNSEEQALEYLISLEDQWEDQNSQDEPENEEVSMFILIRDDLKMSDGKMAAQVGHGVLGTYLKALNLTHKITQKWELSGMKKRFFFTDKEQSLLNVYKMAKTANLPCILIADAGRTQITPGSKTVLAIGPSLVISFDQKGRRLSERV